MRPFETLTLDALPAVTAALSLDVTGTAVKAGSTIRIRGGVFPVEGAADADRRFSLPVVLAANRVQRLFVYELSQDGAESAPVTVELAQDGEPPVVLIDTPVDLGQAFDATVAVVGRVSDPLSGSRSISVSVNGIQARVHQGFGTNATFIADGVPLDAAVPTVITATATDGVGNAATDAITVTRITRPGARIESTGGNQQRGPVHTWLTTPLEVVVRDANGSLQADKTVTWRAVRSDCRLGNAAAGDGLAMVQSRTDGSGIARAFLKLGGDAGEGNNRVEAGGASIANTVLFCASATPGQPSQINVGQGDNQRVRTGSLAPIPLQAWVSDGCNGCADVSVQFTVVEGGGLIPIGGGQAANRRTVTTDATGHAEVDFVATVEGVHVVQATFAGNPNRPAFFTISTLPAAGSTAFAGVVLDNSSQPIAGVTCTLTVGTTAVPAVTTGDDGRFLVPDLAVTGPATLRVEGETATGVNGQPIPATQRFPHLVYDVLVAPGVVNDVGGPVLLPRLERVNDRVYDGVNDVVLTVEGVDGLEMRIKGGSMTIGGQPAPAGTTVALNQVHYDKVPMPMPNGAAPVFSWTLQPAGAHFNPPVQVTYPNMSGLPPGAITNFLSFNHDTGRFEIVATGAVVADGSASVTDRRSGITVAGWGCNCPPYAVASDCERNCTVRISGVPTDPVCPNQLVSLTAAGGPAGGTYSWSGGTATSGSTAAAYGTRFASAGTQRVSVTYRCPSGESATDTADVVVNENSGAQWVARFPGSSSTADLIPAFQTNVDSFIAAMQAAGATVSISATLRPPERAYLMHYSFRIANEGLSPAGIPAMAGVDICWQHLTANGTPDNTASSQAAAAMVAGYDIAFRPALTSRHTEGRAIDMTISWTGALNIRNASGTAVNITSTPRSGDNTDLHAVGATYGVMKLVSDPPHWSDDGH